jgi:hypothetical protein
MPGAETQSGAEGGREDSRRPSPLGFEFHGMRAQVLGDWPEVIEAVRADFGWFSSPTTGEADLELEVLRREPDFDAFGPLRASFVTPRNVVYQLGDQTVVDYGGRAMTVLDRSGGRARIEGRDEHLVYEAAYHLVLSRVGQHLEQAGLVRLHALGLSGRQGAVAVMLPSGGGKSTLAFDALRDDSAELLSDDSPLLDRRGDLHPFPLRMGVNDGDAAELDGKGVRRIERMEFHPKHVLAVEAFAGKVHAGPVPLRHLVIGERSLGRQSALEPLKRGAAIGPLVREAVVGVGIYQGMEFLLQRGLRDLARQVRPAAVRAQCCAAGLARARVWRLRLGRDRADNWAALTELLH